MRRPPLSLRTLIIFARAPELGCVKTRIAAELGSNVALAIYREIGLAIVQIAREVDDCEIVVQYTPGGSEAILAAWLGLDLVLHAQSDGDLGQRMCAAISDAVQHGARRVVVVGTDCPGVDAELLESAFDALGTVDVVLGPATDGGYYLIGVTQPQPALFDGIPWSSSETFNATLVAASAAGLSVSLLDPRSDIDTAADWLRWTESS